MAAISAFNHPLNLIIHQIAPAIAVGCPVIVKPAATTPISCIEIVKLFWEAGLDERWCQTLITEDNALAEAFATDRRVAFLSFIGSAKVGWYLKSKLPPGTRCALEHGGAAPVIVDRSADVDAIVGTIVKGGYYHAGQVCVSAQRLFVHEDILASFTERSRCQGGSSACRRSDAYANRGRAAHPATRGRPRRRLDQGGDGRRSQADRRRSDVRDDTSAFGLAGPAY